MEAGNFDQQKFLGILQQMQKTTDIRRRAYLLFSASVVVFAKWLKLAISPSICQIVDRCSIHIYNVYTKLTMENPIYQTRGVHVYQRPIEENSQEQL